MQATMTRGGTTSAQDAQGQILGLLRDRQAMHIGEIRKRLDLDEDAVQRAIETLIERGDLERLRPLHYEGDDHDFYSVPRPEVAGNPWVVMLQTAAGRGVHIWVRPNPRPLACVWSLAENYIG